MWQSVGLDRLPWTFCRETTFSLCITGAGAATTGQGPLALSGSRPWAWARAQKESLSFSAQETIQVSKQSLIIRHFHFLTRVVKITCKYLQIQWELPKSADYLQEYWVKPCVGTVNPSCSHVCVSCAGLLAVIAPPPALPWGRRTGATTIAKKWKRRQRSPFRSLVWIK